MKFKKKKICYVISSLANEGPTNVLYNIIKFIDLTIFEITIITLVPEKGHSRLDDFLKLDISIVQLVKVVSPKNMILRIVFFKKILNQINPHIVHSHCPRSLIYISFLSKRIKKIYTAHIFPGDQQIALYGNIKGRLIIKLGNFLMMRLDLPITCSESVSREFYDKYGWNLKSISNGCSFNTLNIVEDEKLRIRKSLGLDSEKKYFIFIGRFSEEKKPTFLIEAFGKLNNPQIELIMLGVGPLFDDCIKNINPKVRLVGFKEDILPYLKASDYYVSASQTEGLANTLLESMSVGLPLLLSDIPSHAHVITKSIEQIGFLFDNTNEKEFIEKINSIISLKRNIITDNVQIEYLKKYTAKTMALNYSLAYKSII
jgi:glycosyltransferase involved in cell wall biosynthesis